MITSEPSYFDFLMKRCVCRTRVPFAQAVGVMPERALHVRTRRPERIAEQVDSISGLDAIFRNGPR
jgi:hypothetical protein